MDLNNNSNVLLLLAALNQQQQQLTLLETLFSINQDPSAEAIDMIAQRVNSTSQNVSAWFHARREQLQAHQASSAAAAAAANNHLSNLVLNSLMFDPQQLQQQLQQQQQQQQQSNPFVGCLPNSNGRSSGSSSASGGGVAGGGGGGGGGGGASGGNSSVSLNNVQYYHDYQISNASSSPTSIQQPLQMGAINAMRTSVDSPPDHIQNHHQQDPTGPASSSILAKLIAVTSNLPSVQQQSGATMSVNGEQPPQSHTIQHHHNQLANHVLTSSSDSDLIDSRMIDLLEALYVINDNPEMAAIEMISKRVLVPCHIIADWFDRKRRKLNPFASPRTPPTSKKREGGRVVTFSEYQRSLLEAIFNENNYLHPQEYEELSKLIQVPSRNIKIWFKNRRSKQRLSSGSRVVGNGRCDSDVVVEPSQHINHHHHQQQHHV